MNSTVDELLEYKLAMLMESDIIEGLIAEYNNNYDNLLRELKIRLQVLDTELKEIGMYVENGNEEDDEYYGLYQ